MTLPNNPTCLRIASITGHDFLTAERQIIQAAPLADVIELRLDYWQTLDIAAVARLRETMPLPVIFTLRKKSQGGGCELPEAQRLELIYQLAALAPEYFDLEYDIPQAWCKDFRRLFPSIQLIGSYHNFDETPHDFNLLFPSLFRFTFDIVKIAVFSHNICDTLRLLIFLQTTSRNHRMIGIAMGEYGQISRILAPVMGGIATYGSVDDNSPAAPGQLTLSEMTNIYRINKLNPNTQIYALLGDPVSQSPGHLVHNQTFSSLNKNAVYVKCRVNPDHLAQAMSLLRQLPFYGMSVTIPHKETVVPFLDNLFAEAAILQIVNTVKREDNLYLGFNTDVTGAASVLEKTTPLKQRRCLILGAGGSAKALAYMLLSKQAEVTLCNRTLARALNFTQKFGGKSLDFNSLFANSEFPYDTIINTLPASAYEQQCANWTIPPVDDGIAMDIVLKPIETTFIKLAKTAGWHCITGNALFAAQGQDQLKIWLGQ